MTKEELIKLKEQAATAATAYRYKAEEARKRNAMQGNVSIEWQVAADIEAAKALNVSYAADQAYKQALEKHVKQEAA